MKQNTRLNSHGQKSLCVFFILAAAWAASAQTITPVLLGLAFRMTLAWRTLPVYALIICVLSLVLFTARVKNIKARKVENTHGLEALDGD